MFNLVSDFLSRRKKPLPHCGFADALPRGNLRDGKTVQIVQNHHLAVSAGQEGDAAEDFRQTLGVAAVLVRRLIGQPRERLLGVAVIEQRGPAGAAGAGVGVDIARHTPDEGVRLVQCAVGMRGLDQRKDDVRA